MEMSNWKEIFSVIPLPSLVLVPTEENTFRIIEANEAYLQYTGYTRGDLINKLTVDVFPKNPATTNNGHVLLRASFEKVLSIGTVDVLESVRFDLANRSTGKFEERYWNVKNIPVKNNSGEVELILHTNRDITLETAREKRQEKLQEEIDINRQQYRNFIRENPDGLYRMDLEGNFLHANESLAKIAAIPVEEVLKMSFLPFCAPYHKEFILEQFQLAAKGKTVTFEADFLNAKGGAVILKILLMPMYINGKVAEVHGIAKDISGLKESEKVIVEKNRYLEVNAAFISSLLESDLEDKALYDTFEDIARTVDADRMYYFGADKDEVTGEILISQKVEWCSTRASSQLDNPEMQNMPIKSLEEITAPFKKNLPFKAVLSDLTNGALKEIFLDQDIKSMLLLPIFVEDTLFGFVGFDDCTTERKWKKDEISFLQTLTHNLTNAFEKRIALERVKRKEEDLRKSERKFKALVQEGSDMITIVDPEGILQFISETSTSILGFAPQELLKQPISHLAHPDDRERLQSEFAELGYKKQKNLSPYRLQNKEGDWRWIQSVGTNLRDDTAVNGIVINSRDITTVVDQAREIESINERYQLAATATEDLIYDWDLTKDEITRFHNSKKELFGYPTEVVNKPEFWKTNIHPDDLVKEKKVLSEVFSKPNENHIKTEYRFKKANGTYARVVDKGYILRDENGKAIRLIGATSDVTEITEKREALKIANKRFELAMRATNEVIWDWEVASGHVTRSEGFKNIFGYDTFEAQNDFSFWLDKVISEDQIKVRASINQALSNSQQEKWELEYQLFKANGEVAFVTDRGYIIRDAKGKATRMIGAVLDVTQSRRLINEIKRQNTVLKEIAWEQSHIVRAPVARIKGLLHLLEQEIFDDISREQVLYHIRNSADELDDIIRNIVGKTEEIDVQQF